MRNYVFENKMLEMILRFSNPNLFQSVFALLAESNDVGKVKNLIKKGELFFKNFYAWIDLNLAVGGRLAPKMWILQVRSWLVNLWCS